eukprot:4131154-Pleurochrysis_carterae.AAC.1
MQSRNVCLLWSTAARRPTSRLILLWAVRSHAILTSPQVRIGHNASNREMKFAQVTAHIRGQLVWEITNAKGEIVGGVGSEEDPFTVDDYWVFERYLADDGAWRLKERLETKAEASALGDRGARAAA